MCACECSRFGYFCFRWVKYKCFCKIWERLGSVERMGALGSKQFFGWHQFWIILLLMSIFQLKLTWEFLHSQIGLAVYIWIWGQGWIFFYEWEIGSSSSIGERLGVGSLLGGNGIGSFVEECTFQIPAAGLVGEWKFIFEKRVKVTLFNDVCACECSRFGYVCFR